MASKPDYEPANPPLPSGHPLQYHFDPFLQNAGQFKNEKQSSSGEGGRSSSNGGGVQGSAGGGQTQEQHLSQFKNFNGAALGAFTRQQNAQVTPYNPYQSNPQQAYADHDQHEHEDIEFNNISPPPKKKRKQTQPVVVHHHENGNYGSSDEDEDEDREYGIPSQSNYDASQEPEAGHVDVEYSPPPNRGHYVGRPGKDLTPNPSLHLQHEGESREKGYRLPQQLQQQSQSQHAPQGGAHPHLYSENAYVLMFPNMVPEKAMLPPKPFINGKEIPVVSAASDLSERTRGGIMSPGFHAVKVHPREQMVI